MRNRTFGAMVLAGLLTLPGAAVQAGSTTVNGITLDVPEGYGVSSSKRGLLVKSPDKEVDVWVEVFSAADGPTVFEEHRSYWKKEKVDLHGDGESSKGKSGDVDVVNTRFPEATWKGDPTVLRYSAIGPYGSEKQTVLVTYWASPGGDKEYGDAINKMVGDIGFSYKK